MQPITIVIPYSEIKVRKRKPPKTKVFRDKKKYSRKAKHRKGPCESTAFFFSPKSDFGFCYKNIREQI